MRRVALIGLRGAGKTTLGRMIAAKRRVPFIELDREIELAAGASLAELFLLYGQAAYRRHERRALEALLLRDEPMVIATGGSIVSEPETFDLLLSTCQVVWLKAKPEEHMARVIAQGDQRPMAGSSEAMEDLKRILAGRDLLYRKADAIVDTSGKSIGQSLRLLERAVDGAMVAV
jgi:XRE family aerobic/anaerobic benzoate catabolism transcriptional regulator